MSNSLLAPDPPSRHYYPLDENMFKDLGNSLLNLDIQMIRIGGREGKVLKVGARRYVRLFSFGVPADVLYDTTNA